MKRTLLLLLSLLAGYLSFAQDVNDIGKIPLPVMMPQAIEGLDSKDLTKLEIKVNQIIAASGMAPAGYSPNFAVFPAFTVDGVNVAEGGMQSITVASCELTLFIRQIDNNLLIASHSTHLKGTGSSESAAVSNAVAGIATGDDEYKQFISTSRQQIISFYESRCGDYLTAAGNMAAAQEYGTALGMLMSVPSEAKACYASAQAKAAEVYKAYQNKTCAETVLNARAKIAAGLYNEALDLLGMVDPSSSCSKEAHDLIKTTGDNIAAQQKKAWDLLLRIYTDQMALENHRINTMKEIAVIEHTPKQRRTRRRKED